MGRYLDELVVGLGCQRREVLERRAVIQLVIIDDFVIGVLVHEQSHHMRATATRSSEIKVHDSFMKLLRQGDSCT
jgi:hypothetical protein